MDRERQSPKRNVIPGEVFGVGQWIVRSDKAALSISDVRASPEGLFLSIEVVHGPDVSYDPARFVKFAFDGSRPSDDETAGFRIWLTHGRAEETLSEIRDGGGGAPQDGVAHWAFRLWFPLPVASLSDDIEVAVFWRPLGDSVTTWTLPLDSLQSASDRAIVWH